MNLWVIRHCESVANVDIDTHKTVSNPDIDLSERGNLHRYQVADALTKAIKGSIECWINPRVYYSPFVRAKKTTDAILTSLSAGGVSAKFVRPDVLLSEQSYGDATGYGTAESYLFDHPLQGDIARRVGMFYYRFPQGESLADLAFRADTFLQKMKSEHLGHHVVVVAHRGFNSLLEQQLLGTYSADFEWHNGEIRHYLVSDSHEPRRVARYFWGKEGLTKLEG